MEEALTLFDLSKIELSNRDADRGLILPHQMTTELAEFIGVMIGDGHLGLYVGKQRHGAELRRSEIIISCNIEERQYCEYIDSLFYSLFHIKLSFEPDPRSKAVYLKAHSKAVLQFLNTIWGIPINRKTDTARIPDIIKVSPDIFKNAFLRGLADTDFSVNFRHRPKRGHVYPRIKTVFKSKSLVEDIASLVSDLGFSCCRVYTEKVLCQKSQKKDVKHALYLNGARNFGLWCQNVGFSNPKFIRKAKKCNEEGVCPPGY